MDSKVYLKNLQDRVNDKLSVLLQNYAAKNKAHSLCNAMRYSLLGEGKRLRPLLVYACGEMFNASLLDLDIPACAIECIHCFSLIHDDLPAMDNDDFRRGKPSCHKKFDEALAILVGDALQALAFKHIAASDLVHKATMLQVLSNATLQMIEGQAIDINADQEITGISQLENMYGLKTGALIGASVKLGALVAGIDDPSIMHLLDEFSSSVGLAFQIQDDIADIDEIKVSQKISYPRLVSVEQAQQRCAELKAKAYSCLENIAVDTTALGFLVDYIFSRG